MKIVDVIRRKPVSTYGISACEALVASVNSMKTAFLVQLKLVASSVLARSPLNHLSFAFEVKPLSYLVLHRYKSVGIAAVRFNLRRRLNCIQPRRRRRRRLWNSVERRF